jgi:FkbM family methyltransferase
MCFDAYNIGVDNGYLGSLLDLGANIGIATRYFISRLPSVSVLAVEPSADNCSVFRMNIAIAEAEDRVQLWECGIGPADGNGFLKSVGTMRLDSLQLEYLPKGELCNGEHTIMIRAMGGVVEKLAEPILVKMDIEGSENEVLACRADWIGKVGYMMIEFHDKEKERMWLSVLAAEGWKSEKHFDTWHFHKRR